MERIESAAEISIGRAVGFGTLAIATVMLALVFEPTLALKAGGTMTLLMAAVLQFKALEARSKPYRSTEVWLILDRRLDVPDDQAQRIVGTVLQTAYGRYAGISLAAAFGLWLSGLAFQFLT